MPLCYRKQEQIYTPLRACTYARLFHGKRVTPVERAADQHVRVTDRRTNKGKDGQADSYMSDYLCMPPPKKNCAELMDEIFADY